MEPVSAVMFMSGIILTIVGSGRAVSLRVGRAVVASDDVVTRDQPIPFRVRSDVATLLWVAVALYGLFLASTAVAVSH
jgi:hypothetical protein